MEYDYTTIDGLIFALYDVISGPAGVEPDWRRERELYAPGARLMPSRLLENGDLFSEILTVDDYIASRGPYLRRERVLRAAGVVEGGSVSPDRARVQRLRVE